MLPPNIIILYDSTHASIPTGWARDTRFDSLFVKGAETGLGGTGGVATHTHTSVGHTHAMGAHTHSGVSGTSTGHYSRVGNTASPVAKHPHDHNYTSGAVSGGTTDSTAPTSDAVSNNPPYYEFIFIKSSVYKPIPNNGCLLSAIVQSDLTYHSASEDKFLRGASTSSDAGGTGGSSTNTHDWTHTHATNSHTHTSVTSGVPNQTISENNAAGGLEARADHTHVTSFTSDTQAIGSYTTAEVHSEVVEPLHTKIRVYKNASGNTISLKTGLIALLIDGDNPLGWVTCDGTNSTPDLGDYFIKSTDVTGTTTGGSNTHSHASFSHLHPSSGTHSHTVSLAVQSGNINAIGSGADVSYEGHMHANSTTTTPSIQYASGTIVPNTSTSNEPEYVKAKFIMATPKALASGGGMVFFSQLS